MSDSIRDLAATIAGLKNQAGRLRAAVAADKGTADGLVQRFQAVGVEGGPVARLSGCSAGHERAVSQLEAIESRLERARFIAMSAISGLHGSGAVARSGDQADDPTSWEKPTPETELAEDSKRPRGFQGMMNFLGRRGDDVEDVAKTTGKLLDIGQKIKGLEPTPSTGLTTSTLVREPQIDTAPPAIQAQTGSLLLAGFAATLVGTKATQTVGKMTRRFWKARSRDSR
ncbi:hypothetical protein FB566_3403 [Stackebrandtia endophytica]|uniref:Uncharacterized protein n=1 Tax=Stackebrandtia endophytica TaxID=1496996 RepID=A0A543AZ36_9ACTN|nr:hypothetical protein [Stackebrandtia endophytica]TQL77836.1 hypothetical protein FB566_3403 [Stackebrandtia endophytica]